MGIALSQLMVQCFWFLEINVISRAVVMVEKQYLGRAPITQCILQWGVLTMALACMHLMTFITVLQGAMLASLLLRLRSIPESKSYGRDAVGTACSLQSNR